MLTKERLDEMYRDAENLQRAYDWVGLESTVAIHVKDLVNEVERLKEAIERAKETEPTPLVGKTVPAVDVLRRPRAEFLSKEKQARNGTLRPK